VNICRNESAELVGMEINEFKKCLKTLERVKGIEPSYSAWKAAALPLSYTRARPINYHGRQAASTAMSGFGPLGRPRRRPLFPRRRWRPAGALNTGRFDAYTEASINNERR
jgi:hypothetical protein